jgi:hypothetical protein
MNATRYTIDGTGLTAPKTYPVEVNGWYYLGVSDSPTLVKVVKANTERFWYQSYTDLTYADATNNMSRPVQIERWIGEDLISQGTATQRKHVLAWYADDPEWLAHCLYTLDRHDLPEDSKQELDQAQAEHEVINTPEAENRRYTFKYEVEDAIREHNRIHSAEPKNVTRKV